MTVPDRPTGGAADGSAEYGSDLIVDVLRSLGIEYFSLNPGATIRGLHDSLVNYGGNHAPEMVLCLHEEIAVAVAHGYAKATGRPMAVGLHNLVGLQHASMAIYNAWCDRVPMVLIGGTGPMREGRRRPWIDWIHTANVQGNLVRDFVKWDAQPAGVDAIGHTLARALKTATTLPQGPVYVCFDVDDQEAPLAADQAAPPAQLLSAERPLPVVPASAVDQVAGWVRAAQHPVILADYYNVGAVPGAVAALVRLAEQWAIPVVDLGGRWNFPNQHPLCVSELRADLLREADLVLALDVHDLYGALRSKVDMGTRRVEGLLPAGARVVSASAETVPMGALAADYHAWQPVDLEIPVASPLLVAPLADAVGRPADSAAVEARRARIGSQRAALVVRWQRQLEQNWDARPISTARLAAELWQQLQHEDFVLAYGRLNGWPQRLWHFDAEHPHLGPSGGAGLGYGLGASLGAALACRGTGKIAVDIQPDGDFLFTPSALWTAAHHELPLLIVVHNNRTYYQDELHQGEMAHMRQRPEHNKVVGICIDRPAVQFSELARSMGLWATGPVEDPAQLSAALGQALEWVRRERKPALVDVVAAAR